MTKPLAVHLFQHVRFEGLGSIADWIRDRQASVTTTRFFEKTFSLPSMNDIDVLIVLGGPMSVNDEQTLPWLKDEKRFIGDAIAQGKSVLGICLGSQLIASALGKSVYPGPQKEIGWFPVFAQNRDGGFAFPEQVDVFHWHGETFDLPDDATLLASSAVCRNQAFQIGERVLAFQFHLETTPESALSMVTHCADELVESDTIQRADAIRAAPAAAYADINRLMARALDFITRD